MMLLIAVDGIVVVMHVAIFIIILSRVIVAPVLIVLIDVDSVPGDAAGLVSHKISQPE